MNVEVVVRRLTFLVSPLDGSGVDVAVAVAEAVDADDDVGVDDKADVGEPDAEAQLVVDSFPSLLLFTLPPFLLQAVGNTLPALTKADRGGRSVVVAVAADLVDTDQRLGSRRNEATVDGDVILVPPPPTTTVSPNAVAEEEQQQQQDEDEEEKEEAEAVEEEATWVKRDDGNNDDGRRTPWTSPPPFRLRGKTATPPLTIASTHALTSAAPRPVKKAAMSLTPFTPFTRTICLNEYISFNPHRTGPGAVPGHATTPPPLLT